MRLISSEGHMLVLEGRIYRDVLGLSGFGIVIAIWDLDGVETARIGEEDALVFAVDMGGFGPAEETIHDEDWCCSYIVLPESVDITLLGEREISCSFSGEKQRILMGWFETYKTFCINRLNQTDCILPNQTVRTTKLTMSQN